MEKRRLSEKKDLCIYKGMQGVKILKELEIKFEQFSELKEVWERIFEVTENPAPFVSYGWFFALNKYLLKREVEVMVFYEEGEAVGIIPAELKNHNLSLIGDQRVTDFNGVILDPDYSKKIIGALADFIINENLNIELSPLTEESELIKFLPDMLKIKMVERAETFPVLKLPSSWEKYLTSLSSKNRHELRRKLGKAEGAGIKKLGACDIDKLFELMEYSSGEKKNFLDKEMKDFFKALALYLEGIGALRLSGVFYKEAIIGALFCFQMGNMVYAFNTGYDPDFYKLSPGFISFAMDIKSAIDDGFTYYNFLRGEERFKFDLGAKRFYTWKIKR